MKLSNVIIKPIITEKSASLNKGNKYVFEVSIKSTKHSIINTLTGLYNVEAVDIKTIIMPGKSKRIGKTKTFTGRQNWKKAIITLKEGQKIEGSVKGMQK